MNRRAYTLRNDGEEQLFKEISFVFAATITANCQALIPLGLAKWRILPAASADTRSRTPLISLYTFQLRHLCAAHSLATVSLRPLVQALEICLASGAPWCSTMPPSLGRGRVTTTAISFVKFLNDLEHNFSAFAKRLQNSSKEQKVNCFQILFGSRAEKHLHAIHSELD